MRIMNLRYWLITGILAIAVNYQTLAHPGGVNAEGCHTNRKTGE